MHVLTADGVHMQGNTGQDAVRNVALNNEQPQMLNLLDMDNAGNVDSDSALGPPALIRRTPLANYDETPGEPLRPSRGGVSRSAGIKPQSAAERQVLSGESLLDHQRFLTLPSMQRSREVTQKQVLFGPECGRVHVSLNLLEISYS